MFATQVQEKSKQTLTSSRTTHLARCLEGKNSAYKVTLRKISFTSNTNNKSAVYHLADICVLTIEERNQSQIQLGLVAITPINNSERWNLVNRSKIIIQHKGLMPGNTSIVINIFPVHDEFLKTRKFSILVCDQNDHSKSPKTSSSASYPETQPKKDTKIKLYNFVPSTPSKSDLKKITVVANAC